MDEQNILFQGISVDKGRRIVTAKEGERRLKYRLDSSNFLSDNEQLKALNMICSAIKKPEDLDGFIEFSKCKYGANLREEIKVVAKILGKNDKRFEEYDIEKINDMDKYILVGDIRSGKSYLLASLISESLEKNPNIRKKIKESLSEILSGIGETTVTLYKFILRNNNKDVIKFSYELVETKYIEDRAEEGAEAAYEKIIKNKQKGLETEIAIKAELDGNRFRIKKLLGKDVFLELNKFSIETFSKNEHITKEQYIKIVSEEIKRKIEYSSKDIIEKLFKYSEETNIDNDKLIEIVRYVANKQNASLLKEIVFEINGKNIEKDLEILDSIGLNHGEGTNKLDVNKIRELRISDIIKKYPNHKIIYTINSINTTNLTLKPIDLFDKMGFLNKVKFVVTQLDLLDDYELDEFVEEKIDEKLEYDLVKKIKNNIQAGPLKLEDLTIKKDNNILMYSNNKEDINIKDIALCATDNFIKDIDKFFLNIHWNRMNSISYNESFGQDEYTVGGALIFSIVHLFIVNLFNELDNEKLIKLFDINNELTELEFDKIKNKFKEKLFNSLRVYYILLNLITFKEIYDLRWNSEHREYLNMSMTKERVVKFKRLIFERCKNIDVIIDLIKLALKQ